MTAMEMLRDRSLDPGWFGHPATTTLYCLALIGALVGAVGIVTGQFAGADGYMAALYADPGIVFLPGRLFIVACGVGCVWLTYRIGTRIADRRVGLLAAFFLAINAVHIEYSQIIRTDMQASLFMLLASLCALAILRDGRRRDYVCAAIFVGLACATKWPAAVIVVDPLCAGFVRLRHDRGGLVKLALVPVISLATLFLVSPYLLLDTPTVLRDLAGEARPLHPGATSGGFFAALGWYATQPLLGSLGMGGLLCAGAGLVAMAVRSAGARAALLPGALAFLVVISTQSLMWERWVVPLLPFAALAIAYALALAGDTLAARVGSRWRAVPWGIAALLAVPMLWASAIRAEERAHDTRQIAAAWVRAHVPAGATILVEHAAFDLFHGPWRLLFPVGSAGCVDVREALSRRVRYSNVEKLRRGSPVVDVGHVDPARLATCRADYAVFTHYRRYDEPVFAPQRARYRALMQDARVVAVIRPIAGQSSGPEVVIARRTRR